MFNKKSKEKIQALEQKNKELEDENIKLKKETEIKKSVYYLLEENIPSGENDRKKYMGDIALFYISIFKDKLAHFKGLQMYELSQLGRSEKMNDIIRSNINCFQLIGDWMEEKTKEHLGDLEQMRNSFEENGNFISKFKETYGEN